MRTKFFLLTAILGFSFLFIACDEALDDFGTASEEDVTAIEDNNMAEKGMVNIVSAINPYGIDEDLTGKKSVTNGPTVTWENMAEFILRFDFTDVEGSSGVILADFDFDPFDLEFMTISATLTFIDYTIDGVTYGGSLSFALVRNDDGSASMTMSTPDGEEFTVGDATWMGYRTFSWTEGFDTPTEPADDYYQVVGEAEGVTSAGYNYTSDVVDPLIFGGECEYIMYGTSKVVNKPGEEEEASLTLKFNVDSNGNELSEPACNPYFEMHYVSSMFEFTYLYNSNEME